MQCSFRWSALGLRPRSLRRSACRRAFCGWSPTTKYCAGCTFKLLADVIADDRLSLAASLTGALLGGTNDQSLYARQARRVALRVGE